MACRILHLSQLVWKVFSQPFECIQKTFPDACPTSLRNTFFQRRHCAHFYCLNKMAANEGTKVWLITGATSGFGRAFVEYGLQKGYKVAVVVRSPEKVKDIVNNNSPEQLLVLQFDINDRSAIEGGIKQTVDKFGRIDVLINNAGYNMFGPIEETSEEQIRQTFDTNFFSQVAFIKRVIPIMRSQGSGDIVQVTSVRGSIGDPGAGVYSATKFALDGFCESLSKEVNQFGIRVVIVKPGAFRTEINNPKGNLTIASSTSKHYAGHPAGTMKEQAEQMYGKEPGDPYRAAVALDKALSVPSPPLHLLLGSDCLDGVLNKLNELSVEYRKWEEVSRSTDFPSQETKESEVLPVTASVPGVKTGSD